MKTVTYTAEELAEEMCRRIVVESRRREFLHPRRQGHVDAFINHATQLLIRLIHDPSQQVVDDWVRLMRSDLAPVRQLRIFDVVIRQWRPSQQHTPNIKLGDDTLSDQTYGRLWMLAEEAIPDHTLMTALDDAHHLLTQVTDALNRSESSDQDRRHTASQMLAFGCEEAFVRHVLKMESDVFDGVFRELLAKLDQAAGAPVLRLELVSEALHDAQRVLQHISDNGHRLLRLINEAIRLKQQLALYGLGESSVHGDLDEALEAMHRTLAVHDTADELSPAGPAEQPHR